MTSRPALEDLLGQAKPGDALVVRRLDRLGRSLRHLIDTVGEREERNVAVTSLTEAMDHIDARRHVALPWHASFGSAQFERELLRERTMAGLTAPVLRALAPV